MGATQVVISILCTKGYTVRVVHAVGRVAVETVNVQLVVVLLGGHGELVIFHHPVLVEDVDHVDLQAVVLVARQVVEELVAEPVLSVRFTEPDGVFRPGPCKVF